MVGTEHPRCFEQASITALISVSAALLALAAASSSSASMASR